MVPAYNSDPDLNPLTARNTLTLSPELNPQERADLR
jgi:hypothetical protein